LAAVAWDFLVPCLAAVAWDFLVPCLAAAAWEFLLTCVASIAGQFLIASVAAAGFGARTDGSAAHDELVEALRALDLLVVELVGNLALVATEGACGVDLHGGTWPRLSLELDRMIGH